MNVMNVMNVVNVGEHVRNAIFTTYPYETKELVNVVNVVRRFFARGARELPNFHHRHGAHRGTELNPPRLSGSAVSWL